MYRGQDLSWRDSEDRPTSNAEICCAEGIRAIPAPNSCAIEIPVRGTNKRGFGINANAGQGGQRASRREFEDRPTAGASAIVAGVVGTSELGCPVEIPVGALDQSARRTATACRIKRVKGGEYPGWDNFENCPTPSVARGAGPA